MAGPGCGVRDWGGEGLGEDGAWGIGKMQKIMLNDISSLRTIRSYAEEC